MRKSLPSDSHFSPLALEWQKVSLISGSAVVLVSRKHYLRCRVSTLQDQLLKAGLVNDKQAKKVKKDKRKTDKVQRKSKEVVVDETKAQVAKARAEKVDRDRELNEQRMAEAERKAIAAQVKQLIQMNRQPKGGGDTAYNFTDGKQIKKIFVSDKVRKLLERGRGASVRLG